MRILLDECVPWPMHKLLASHECTTTQKYGWGGIKNGELLRRAEGQFGLFITADQNIRYQQNVAGFHIAILELSMNRRMPRQVLECASLLALWQWRRANRKRQRTGAVQDATARSEGSRSHCM